MIDGASGTVVANVDVRARTCGVAANPRTNRIYVTSLDTSAVTVVDGSSLSVVDTVLTPAPACGVAVNSQTNEALPNDVDVDPQADGIYVVNKTARSLVTNGGDLRPAA